MHPWKRSWQQRDIVLHEILRMKEGQLASARMDIKMHALADEEDCARERQWFQIMQAKHKEEIDKAKLVTEAKRARLK